MKYKEFKNKLKVDAKKIRELKAKRKTVRNGLVIGLIYLREDYRHHHIAYCLLRGRTMEQIEKKCAKDNMPCVDWVKQIRKIWEIKDVDVKHAVRFG